MKNKVTLKKVNVEAVKLADDFNFEGDVRNEFIEHITCYVADNEVKSWDEVYGFVNGLLTKFDHNFNLA